MKKQLIQRVIRKLYPLYCIQPSDVFLITYPKSGTTWLRFIFCNIVSLIYLNGRTVDYHLLNGDLRCAFDSFHFPTIWPENFPRLFVSHQKYNKKKFGRNKCIYLFRNPGDVMVSFYEYRKSLKEKDLFDGDFKEFIRDEELGIPAWCKHYSSWSGMTPIAISYEKLKEDTFEVMVRVLDNLNLRERVPDDVLREAIRRSNFKNVRKLEETKGLDEKASERHKAGFKFARKGEVGQWQYYFDKNDLSYLQSQCDEFNLTQIKSYYSFNSHK